MKQDPKWTQEAFQSFGWGNPKGNPPWIFIGRTVAEAEAPILWPTDAKNWLIGKDLDAQSLGLPKVGHDWVSELNWTELWLAEGSDDGWIFF